MELIEFIAKNKPFKSEPETKPFKEIYGKRQNGGIVGDDVLRVIKRYNKDISLVMDNTCVLRTQSVLFYPLDGSHMFFIYVNDEGFLEKYDSDNSDSHNNCTLMSFIAAMIRPFTTYKKTLELLKKCKDKKDNHDLIAKISKHYFNRSARWFRY
jgi:hypothetical protein